MSTAASDSTERNYLNYPKGIMSWVFTLDHKRIGMMYLASVAAAFGLGGFFALAIRAELVTPQIDLMKSAAEFLKFGVMEGEVVDDWTNKGYDLYNHVMTLHGAVMVFLFIIPSIPAALGNFLVPIQLGCKDVAFPRLNLLSFYIYVFGTFFVLASLVMGNIDTGWTFYTPYSTSKADMSVIPMTLGVFIMGFSSILTGLNFIVTIHKMRPPGMTWFKMPLFIWGMYATSLIQILATPVLGITLLLLILERTLGIGIFDPANGGDPVLFQHFFWFYSHPAVYIMILPGMAIVSELIAVHSHKTIFGYKLIGFSSIAIALLGFLVWGHHMFVSGESEFSATVFSFLTFFIAIPSGIKVFNWMTTMYRGQIVWTVPMLYGVGFLINFAIGGLTGLFLGTMGTDIHLHDTYFVVAHFHYVMMGSTVIAFMGGLHHWWPKMTGKMYNRVAGTISFFLVMIGFNVTFYSQFFMGGHGMPRRYASYDAFDKTELFTRYHGFSSIGALILGLGFILMSVYLLHSLFKGKKAPANPWGGLSLEWQTTSPPPTLNFHEDPKFTHGPYDYDRVLPDKDGEL